jgi:hypothetical protein
VHRDLGNTQVSQPSAVLREAMKNVIATMARSFTQRSHVVFITPKIPHERDLSSFIHQRVGLGSWCSQEQSSLTSRMP